MKFVFYRLDKSHFYILAKNQAIAEQHLEAELLTFENYSHSSSTLSSKKNWIHSNKQMNKCVCINEIMRLMTMADENERRSYINRP